MHLSILVACACAVAVAFLVLIVLWIQSRGARGLRNRLATRVRAFHVHQPACSVHTAKTVSVTTFLPDAVTLSAATTTTRSEPLEHPEASVWAGGVSVIEASEHSEILVELE